MNMFKNMKLGTMLGSGFALLILIGFLVAAFGRVQLTHLGDDIQLLSKVRINNLLMMQEVKDNVNTVARAIRDLLLLDDPAAMETEKQKIEALLQQNTQLLSKIQAGTVSPEAQARTEKLVRMRIPYNNILLKTIAYGQSGQNNEARHMLFGDLRQAQDEVFKALDDMVALQETLTVETANASVNRAGSAGILMLIIAACAALLGALVAWGITRRVKSQLGGEPSYAAEIARYVAQGNLAVPVALRRGDTSSVLSAMSAMRDSLRDMVTQVHQSSESIATGANQIAMGNADLSQRTEEQASNLQQTAASMEQMSTTIRQNADSVRAASQLANSASDTATKGGDVVNNVVHTMEEITSSSRKIGDIIGVIDGIAFQTNILALNAAVEAARAGEQGRGFAVVAGEVRSLAQRSASAAKEIKELIGESVEKVETGSHQVNEAGSTMDEIVGQVRRVADLLREIGVTTDEQSQGISQVNDAVNQLDEVTQQNAALVEQSATAADSLSDQARRLVELMGAFRLHDGEPRSEAPRSDAGAPASRLAQPLTLPSGGASGKRQQDWESF
ncbi:methyl-accepting chemotaxis protein [Affinibrenneria salicis]|uniref:Methyl-accepting chemotaxis protein n=1 Tax=Affinibrenneria salicis TaxID=2590031 RepID=A0A5J5FZG3_9GAMM|nr:methyl-accepting chemotaxis protein [Affinibrenneria salicis]KAA8998557.1 methyl-accepting chemotaxis protein [Affinibrenneria salicis]